MDEINAMRFMPAFKELTDEAWLKAAKQFFPNAPNLSIKDGILYIP